MIPIVKSTYAPENKSALWIDTSDRDLAMFRIYRYDLWEALNSMDYLYSVLKLWKHEIVFDYDTFKAAIEKALLALDDTISNLEDIVKEVQDLMPNKVDKVEGKQLSTEDFTTALKDKLLSLSNYNDTAVNNAIELLRNDINTIVKGDTSTAIESFNEIIAFLSNISDSDTLLGIIAGLNATIANETTRAKSAEKDNANNIVSETNRAKEAELTNSTAILEEVNRATIAENENTKAISDESSRAILVENTKVDKESGKQLIETSKITSYDEHISSTSNPHLVTKTQIGLDNVDNTSDVDKPISTAVLTALDACIGKPYLISGEKRGEVFNDLDNNVALGYFSHAEGANTSASGDSSHTEGYSTKALGSNSHAEGWSTKASGTNTHVEGANTTALGNNSHAEGYKTETPGLCAHAEGSNTIASGYASHSEGSGTKASSSYQHVQGQYNVEDNAGKYVDIIGWGTDDERANIETTSTTGIKWLADDVRIGGTNQDDTAATSLKTLNTTVTNIENSVISIRDTITNKVDKVSGKQLSTEDYTTAEKTKLSGIAANANNYVHPTTAGNKHIPAGGTVGQILVNTGDGTAEWQDNQSGNADYTSPEYIFSYGVEWDITASTPVCTRVGNPLLHSSLPIQSNFRGCVANGGKVNYYLDPNDWSKKLDGTDSNLDGTDGDVRIHTPKFYGRSFILGNKRLVRVSTILIDSTWVEIPSLLIDFSRCTVDLANSKTVCVVNTSTNYRGGSNRSSYDTYLGTDIFKTDLGKPRTSLPRSTMRNYAKNANSSLLCYEYYKWIFYWLYVIEYANFNCQAAYNSELTSNGYRQGGLGDGVTTWSGDWSTYNSYNPIIPIGYTNSIGNFTGLVSATIGAGNVAAKTFQVPRWRGFEEPFGDIWTNLDGVIIQNYLDDSSVYSYKNVYTSRQESQFADTINSSYNIVGTEIHLDGWTKTFDLRETAEIIPYTIGGGSTTYKCDYHWTGNKDASLRTLLVGGRAGNGSSAGLGTFGSSYGVGGSSSAVGFRSYSLYEE